MFEYAKDHGYIASNPFPELKVTVKFRQVSKPTCETERVIPVVHKAQEIFKLLKENAPDAKPDDKLRKTYASRLNAAGLPLDQIRACLGHSNTTTTLGYIYNPLTPEESLNIMEKAFSN